MITNTQYKLIAGQIAKLFCNTDLVCMAAVKQRIITNFNDQSFETFLTNIEYGRFYLLKYSNWRVHNNHCRNMAITATITDAVTGEIKIEEWYYDNADCQNKQWYFPDLNNLIKVKGNILIDAPIKNNTTAEITKSRLMYNKNKPSYGITYTPPTPGGGGGGGITITPPTPVPVQPPINIPNVPAASGFDIKSLLENPILLIGVGLVAVYLLMKK